MCDIKFIAVLVAAAKMGWNHHMGGGLEGTRGLVGSSSSSLTLVGVGQLGGLVEMGGEEIQMVEREEAKVGMVVVIDRRHQLTQGRLLTLSTLLLTLSFPDFFIHF